MAGGQVAIAVHPHFGELFRMGRVRLEVGADILHHEIGAHEGDGIRWHLGIPADFGDQAGQPVAPDAELAGRRLAFGGVAQIDGDVGGGERGFQPRLRHEAVDHHGAFELERLNQPGYRLGIFVQLPVDVQAEQAPVVQVRQCGQKLVETAVGAEIAEYHQLPGRTAGMRRRGVFAGEGQRRQDHRQLQFPHQGMARHPRMHDRAQAGLQDVRNAGIHARHLVETQDAVPVPLGIPAAERAVHRLHQLQVSRAIVAHAAIVGHRVMHEHVVHDGKPGMAPAHAPDLAVKLRIVADVVKSGINVIQRRPVNTGSIEPPHRRICFQLR